MCIWIFLYQYILFNIFHRIIAYGLISYHVHFFISKFFWKNLKALPSQHHRSNIVVHFFISNCFIISKCLLNDHTYGALFCGKINDFVV